MGVQAMPLCSLGRGTKELVEGAEVMELKPCPFCGHEAAMQTFTTAMEKVPRFRVICPMCRIQTDWDFWKPEDVAEHWNRRAHETD
jgi:Lar family restriction alleviation protein